jgi:hypothetical protein
MLVAVLESVYLTGDRFTLAVPLGILCPVTTGGEGIMLHKFQAEIRQTPALTILHTLNCPSCNRSDATARIVRARNVSEATLDLIATYMSNDVRREVTACRCTQVIRKPAGGFWSRLRRA